MEPEEAQNICHQILEDLHVPHILAWCDLREICYFVIETDVANLERGKACYREGIPVQIGGISVRYQTAEGRPLGRIHG